VKLTKADVDRIIADSRRRVTKDVTCPECGQKSRESVHPRDTHMLCSQCCLKVGRAFLRKISTH